MKRTRAAVFLAGFMAVAFPATAQATVRDSFGTYCDMPMAQNPYVYVSWSNATKHKRWDLVSVFVGCASWMCDPIDKVAVSVSDGATGQQRGSVYFLMPDKWKQGLVDVKVPELKTIQRGDLATATVDLVKTNGRKCRVVQRGFIS